MATECMFWLRNKKIKFSLRTLNLSPVRVTKASVQVYISTFGCNIE